uniref:Uncharacterized protein n=1 Tax=uncultured bacterium contig00032 TaxID=1181521 RepID=A0A806JY51_9BACT|nr:hypothetical protein [uncultured bacterium contig00032]
MDFFIFIILNFFHILINSAVTRQARKSIITISLHGIRINTD